MRRLAAIALLDLIRLAAVLKVASVGHKAFLAKVCVWLLGFVVWRLLGFNWLALCGCADGCFKEGRAKEAHTCFFL